EFTTSHDCFQKKAATIKRSPCSSKAGEDWTFACFGCVRCGYGLSPMSPLLVGNGTWERLEAIGRVCPSLMVGARISAILTGTSTLCLKKGQEVGELLLGQAGIQPFGHQRDCRWFHRGDLIPRESQLSVRAGNQ